jgi:hypothetical protein
LYLRHLCEFPVGPLELPYTSDFLDAVVRAYRLSYTGDREEWLAKWPLHKRVAILRSEHLDELEFGRLEATIKREVAHKYPKRARLIQAYRNLRTQAHYAMEHVAFQKALFNVAGGGDLRGYELYPGIYIAGTSGWSAQRLGFWADLHVGWRLYERDGERWDSTMQLVHHSAKWRFMEACDPGFAKRVRADYTGRGRFRYNDTFLRYISCGAVKSGHNDTTSGNSLVNLLVAANSMRDCGMRGSIIAIGDDLLAAVEGQPDFDALAARERAYGILPTYTVPVNFAHATYASSTWLWDGSRHLYVPLLGRLFARQWWSVAPPPPRKFAQRRHTIACGMLSMLGGVPVYDEYYRPHLIPRGRVEYDVLRYKAAGPLDVDGFNFEVAFQERYGISPVELGDLREYLRCLPREPCYILESPHDLIARIVAIDAPGADTGRRGADILRDWGCFGDSETVV